MFWSKKFLQSIGIFGVAFLIWFAYLHQTHPYPTSNCVGYEDLDLDMLEYHFLSYNLYKHGQFPVFGFLDNSTEQTICAIDTFGIPASKIYFEMLNYCGPVTFLPRPPIYPVLLAGVYTLTGYSPHRCLTINLILMAALTSGIIAACFFFMGYRGCIIGTAAACLYYMYSDINLYHLSPDLLLIVLLTLFGAFFLIVITRGTKKLVILSGVFYAFLLLTKITTMMFLPSLIFIFFLRFTFINFIKHFLLFLLGAALVILPWTIFLNIKHEQSKTERAAWHQKLNELYPKVGVNLEKIRQREPLALENWLRTILKTNYDKFINTKGPYFITTQFLGLGTAPQTHNEYCVDGDLHFEWMIDSTGYYLTHYKDFHSLKPVFGFYSSHPKYLITISWAKLKRGFLTTNFPFLPIVLILSTFILLRKSILKRGKKFIYAILLVVTALISFCLLNGMKLDEILLVVALFSPMFLLLKNSVDINAASDVIHLLFIFFFYSVAGVMIAHFGSRAYTEMLDPFAWIIFCFYTYILLEKIIAFPFQKVFQV